MPPCTKALLQARLQRAGNPWAMNVAWCLFCCIDHVTLASIHLVFLRAEATVGFTARHMPVTTDLEKIGRIGLRHSSSAK